MHLAIFSAVSSYNFKKVKIFIQYSCQIASFLATWGISCQRNSFHVKGINFTSKLLIFFYIQLLKIMLFRAKSLHKTTIFPHSEKRYPTLIWIFDLLAKQNSLTLELRWPVTTNFLKLSIIIKKNSVKDTFCAIL